MKIVAIADTHGAISQWMDTCKDDILDADCVVVLGDICDYELKAIDSLFDVPIFGVYGNHDVPGAFDDTKIINVHKNPQTIFNRSIIGFQGSVKYKQSQIFGYTQEESVHECLDMSKCSILIAHDAPFGYGAKDNAHLGLKGLYEYVCKRQPDIMLFGHHHKNRYFRIKNTDCYNIYGIRILNI